MDETLNRNLFLIKEHTGIFKAANNFDIYDPATGKVILECREETLGLFTKLFRFSKYKKMTPFDIRIKAPTGQQIVRVSRGICLFLSKVDVFDKKDQLIGGFRQKLFSIGGSFRVVDAQEKVLCHLNGKWTGWDFRFLNDDDTEFAHVAKKWAGLGKELFTTADNYMLKISQGVPADSPLRPLILAAVMCIDMVLKE